MEEGSADLNVATRTEGYAAVVVAQGEIDLSTIPLLTQKLDDLIAEGQVDLIIDMAGVDFIDSTGLGVLVRTHHHAKEHGQEFALVKGAGQVERLLGLTGLSEQLPVAETPEELLGGV